MPDLVLPGSFAGYSQATLALPAAPASADQVIYVFRDYIDSTSVISDDNLPWNCAAYHGFKFDSVHMDTNGYYNVETGYQDFFGCASFDGGYQPAYGDDFYYSASSRRYGSVSLYGSYRKFYLAGGIFAISLSSGLYYDGTTTANSATDAAFYTNIWRVYSSAIDDRVHYELWTSANSVDLTTFDIETDLDPNDPYAVFPYGNASSVETGDANYNVVGTNWRPSTGVMAFPTHFLAKYPSTLANHTFTYIGVQYSEQGVILC